MPGREVGTWVNVNNGRAERQVCISWHSRQDTGQCLGLLPVAVTELHKWGYLWRWGRERWGGWRRDPGASCGRKVTVPVTSRIHYFPVFPKDNVRKERLIWAPRSRVYSIMKGKTEWQQGNGAAGHTASMVEGGGGGTGVQLSPFPSVQHLSPWNGTIHI